jgi:hypothetical protein
MLISTKVWNRRFACLAVCLGASAAWLWPARSMASINFSPAFSYETYKTSTNTSGPMGTSDSKMLSIDARLGYVFDENGLYLGAMYRHENDSYISGEMSGSAYGPSAGYVKSGFSFIVTYQFSADRKYTFNGVESKLTQGHGVQVDLGYAPEISPGFGLGPQLTYRSIRYDKLQVGSGAEVSTADELTTLDPVFVVWFKF